ncbi:hypothetical protein PN456_04380 [Nodularia spumigena CS-586/05]|uniref:hypothetical protein n=1 Tax=Nodularia spumigena TaxID=70799 RepID=UPI00232BE8D0|nr:hypothetical protein [Nodularia spumigena]MDB9357832.1 hypothetical protein [Nodularia spumigena CS-587/03]MDB9399242.1 hypothetical protein [Microcystis aeruginosa CS-567/02-A1]MDB9497354.1 hypothetical protein [Nodularia spumigena CS-336/02]MDB9533411.1 hypothetical protein [Nodularia spumigena CS-1038]MDB9341011.1 hypothetical protein [Nodularia spumigena CS-589/07]
MHNPKVKEIVEALELSVEELNATIDLLKIWDEGLKSEQPILEELSRKQLNSSFSKVQSRLNELYVRLFLISN